MADESLQQAAATEPVENADEQSQGEETVTEGAEEQLSQVDGTDANDDAEPEEITSEEFEELRANEVAFSWQASEYVHNHKGQTWYLGLTVLIVLLIGLSALLHYWLEIVAFMAMGAAIVVYARRAPRTLLYELTPTGISVDGRESLFTDFRSFGVVSELEWHTIDLEPTKRFSTRLAIIFDSDDFDAIVGHLELHLPRVDRDPDVIERLTRLVRF